MSFAPASLPRPLRYGQFVLRPIVIATLVTQVLVSCGGESPPDPPGTVAVVVSMRPAAPRPGDTVTIEATASPGVRSDRVNMLHLELSGLASVRDSLMPGVAGPATISRRIALPLAVGELTARARATASRDATGADELHVTLDDPGFPVTGNVTFSPPVLHPGDTLAVMISATDSVSLRYTVVRLSGAVTAVDSVSYTSRTPAVTRTATFVIPVAAPVESAINVGVAAGNLANRRTGGATGVGSVWLASPASPTPTPTPNPTPTPTPTPTPSNTPPTITGSISGERQDGAFLVGDTVRVNLSARDDGGLSRVGYTLRLQTAVADSISVSGLTATATFRAVVQPADGGSINFGTVFAVDSAGNRVSQSVTAYVEVTKPSDYVSLPGGYDLVYDAARQRIYVSQPDSGAIAVVATDDANSLVRLPSIVTGARPHGLDLTVSGDSLVVAVGTSELAFVDLRTGSVGRRTVVYDTSNGRHTESARVAANGRVIFTVLSETGGPGGSLLQYLVASDSVLPETGTAGAPTSGQVPLAVSADRRRVYGAFAGACCSGTTILVYDATTGAFASQSGAFALHRFDVSANATGSRFLVGPFVYDASLSRLGTLINAGSYRTALSPDARYTYYSLGPTLRMVPVISDEVLGFRMLEGVERIIVTPDSRFVFGISATRLHRVPVR